MGTVFDEQHFRETETFGATVMVGLLLANVHSRFELCVVIYTDVALFLYDIPNNLPPCGCSETLSSLSEDVHQILCKITASQTKDGVMQSMTFVDGDCVGVRRASPSVLHVIPIRDGPVLNGTLNVFSRRKCGKAVSTHEVKDTKTNSLATRLNLPTKKQHG